MRSPDWEKEGIRLFLGDAVSLLPALVADVTITDPPYGNGTPYKSYIDTKENLQSLINSFLPICLANTKNTLITCGVANLWLYPKPKWTLCWTEPAGCGSGPWGFCCWQPILAYGKDPFLSARLGRRPDLFQGKGAKAGCKEHPCAKPPAFMNWLVIRGTAKEETTILDPFMGSGSTLVAAIETKRKGIGIEIDPDYFSIAVNRCEQALQQRQ